MAQHNFKGSVTVKCEVSGNMTMIYNFAHQHMQSAIKFTELAGEVERDNSGGKYGAVFGNIRTYVSSAIILSVCALEANINEHLVSSNGILKDKDYENSQKMLILQTIEQRGIKDKYLLGLALSKKPLLTFDKEPFESFQYLITFRNSLVHYGPESDQDLRASKKLGKNLRTKIEESPLTNKRDNFLTMRAMSHSCAKWAVKTALNFSDEYSRILKITNKFSSLKSEEKPKN